MKRLLHILAASALAVSALSISSATATAPSAGRLAISDLATGQLYTLDPSGAALTQITHLGSRQLALDPQWSPDGTRLAYTVVLGTGRERMFTSAADGTDVHQILADSVRWRDDTPDYFPDGEHVAFARCENADPGICAIYRVGTDGSGLTELTSPALDVFDFNPDVSPDGTRISFVRFNHRGIRAQVWVMNADGTDAHPITRPALEANYPNWSADGATLTVSSNCCRLGGNIYRIAATGGPTTQLTTTGYPNYSGFGAASPNGRRIAFVSDRDHPDKCCVDLWTMNADGSHQVRIDTGLTNVITVTWGPAPSG